MQVVHRLGSPPLPLFFPLHILWILVQLSFVQKQKRLWCCCMLPWSCLPYRWYSCWLVCKPVTLRWEAVFCSQCLKPFRLFSYFIVQFCSSKNSIAKIVVLMYSYCWSVHFVGVRLFISKDDCDVLLGINVFRLWLTSLMKFCNNAMNSQ